MKVKKAYETLLNNEGLRILYPQLSGSWEKDKKEFTKLWNQTNNPDNYLETDFNGI